MGHRFIKFLYQNDAAHTRTEDFHRHYILHYQECQNGRSCISTFSREKLCKWHGKLAKY